MMVDSVNDLMATRHHQPEDARFTAAQFDLYRIGWDYALVVVVKTLQVTMQRFELIERTKRLEAKRRRAGK